MREDEDSRGAAASSYMHWAKVRPPARFNLASSGAPDLTLADLPPLDVGPELTSPHAYGYPPLMDAIAARYGASAENVVTATGTSMANHLAIAALIGHGDDVLMEWPGYEPLVATARFLGASVRFFQRGPEQGFAVDAAELARLLTHKTRLIVLTNPHNPSGGLIGEDELTRIGAVAAKVRAHVLVDEAYLDVVAGARSAFHSGPQFVATSSLAKSYGLSGLRCGWILCEQETAQRIWRLYDLFEASPVYLAERTSHALFPYLDRVLERTRGLIERNRRTLHALYDRSEDVAGIRTGEGSIAFPKVLRGDADRLCKLLIERYEVAVAPGRFFGLEYHFRIGLARDPEMFVQGIERLEAALNEVRRA